MTTRYGCRRCDWAPTGEDQRYQLEDHATDASHPICVVCRLSLARTELQTCLVCLASVRRDLHRITDLYATLPDELGHPRAVPLDVAGGGHDDESPIPGGQILPLLAAGSRGLTQVSGAPTSAGGRDFSHENDETASDPQSVAFELSRWEDHWRIVRREPASELLPTVTGCSAYLHRNMGWAADHEDTFDEFADTLTTLTYRLERVTGNDEPTAKVGAPCFECGADLRRAWTDQGLADDWTCPRCKQVYPDANYWLAVRGKLEDEMRRRKEEAKAAAKAARDGAA